VYEGISRTGKSKNLYRNPHKKTLLIAGRFFYCQIKKM